MILGNLKRGDYAITDEGMGVLGLSDSSFAPLNAEIYANVVHLANGIGNFLKSGRCKVVSADEAWAAAKKW
jgi:hypothetical protein